MAGVSTEDLKNKVSIVEVVSDYVALKKAGSSHKGLCPFHDDKNPSLHVDDEKGMFYCFSCRAGGDVFTFLQRIKACDFEEALREVSQKAGVEAELFAGRKSSNEDLFEINKAVCGFFRDSLSSDRPESGKAFSYLKNRGISSDTAEHFSIGYAPLSGSAIPAFLSSRGYSLKKASRLGLVSLKDGSSEPYGRFRGRLMFSIFSPDSRVIGFGGRILDENVRAPKYLNSSESEVYRKRRSLYGLDKTRQEIRKSGTAVLVEGYTDLLSVYSAGVKNVAASLGTSLTAEQVGLLTRYADEAVILYDGDSAGMDASFSAGEAFMAKGVIPRLARLPEGFDPDSFSREKGSEALLAVIRDAVPLTGVLMDEVSSALLEKRVSQSVAAKKLMAIVPILGDSPEVGPYIREVSRRFGFRERDLYSTVSLAGGKPSPVSHRLTEEPVPQGPGPAEMMLLRIVLKFPDMADFICGEDVMKHIPEGRIREIISSVRASGIAGAAGAPSVSESADLLSRAHFTLEEIDFIDEGNVRVEVEKCLLRLKLDCIAAELKSVRESLRSIESASSDRDREYELMKHYRDLLSQKKLLMEGL